MPTNSLIISYKGKYALWRIVYILIFGTLITAAMATYYFIYQNIYFTLANANIIIAIKSNAGIYELDVPAYENAAKLVGSKKQTISVPKDIRNIFLYINTVSTTKNHATSSQP